ncbi:MAG TPA: DUF4157 domain-containing protein [Longimicrobium sp.]|nr:DUF4157 domain-containing protein [Longimicrobium sp.]
MMKTTAAPIQPCACGKKAEPGPARQRGFEPEVVQRKSAGAERGFGEAAVHPGVLRPPSGGAPLPGPVRARMEAAFGHDFGNVRIHHGGGEAESIGALAYARGSHLHFAPGQYQPHTPAGQRILGHELAHVVQQRAGRVPHPGGAVPVNADPALEREADVAGARAVAVRPSSLQPTGDGGAPAAGGIQARAAGAGPVIQRIGWKELLTGAAKVVPKVVPKVLSSSKSAPVPRYGRAAQPKSAVISGIKNHLDTHFKNLTRHTPVVTSHNSKVQALVDWEMLRMHNLYSYGKQRSDEELRKAREPVTQEEQSAHLNGVVAELGEHTPESREHREIYGKLHDRTEEYVEESGDISKTEKAHTLFRGRTHAANLVRSLYPNAEWLLQHRDDAMYGVGGRENWEKFHQAKDAKEGRITTEEEREDRVVRSAHKTNELINEAVKKKR